MNYEITMLPVSATGYAIMAVIALVFAAYGAVMMRNAIGKRKAENTWKNAFMASAASTVVNCILLFGTGILAFAFPIVGLIVLIAATKKIYGFDWENSFSVGMEVSAFVVTAMVLLAPLLVVPIEIAYGGSFPPVIIYHGKADTRVLVLGNPSPILTNILQSEEFRLDGITYMGNLHADAFSASLFENQLSPANGKTYKQAVIVDAPVCYPSLRDQIAETVDKGIKVIFLDGACATTSVAGNGSEIEDRLADQIKASQDNDLGYASFVNQQDKTGLKQQLLANVRRGAFSVAKDGDRESLWSVIFGYLKA